MSGSGGVSVKAGPSAKPYGGRRAAREAQRRALRKAARGDEPPERTDPDAALLCGHCGRLEWPSRAAGDPHRFDLEAQLREALRGTCRHCGERGFIDLGLASNALALRDSEDDEARAGSLAVRAAAVGLGGLGVGAMIGFIAGGGSALVLGVAGLAALVGVLVMLRHHQVTHVGEALPLPTRWAMALPPAKPTERAVQGPAVPTGEPLRAPLTGRACVAYEVGVRRDDDGDGASASWALLEQRVGALQVQGETIDPSRIHLELRRRRLGTRAELSLDDAAQAFLRQRGLGAEATELVLFEAIVEAGTEVRVALGPEGGVLRSTDGTRALAAGADA